jgi:hypothetical protein
MPRRYVALLRVVNVGRTGALGSGKLESCDTFNGAAL